MDSIITFCPSCGKKVDEIEILDVHADGFQCENDHYLHILKSEVYTSQTMGSYLTLTSGKEAPEDILKEWLCNPYLRDHLNDDLAGIIRFILDKHDGKKTVKEPLEYTYCPSCGEVLQDVSPEGEYHEAVLKCGNNHTFLRRGGMRAVGSRTHFGFDENEQYFVMAYKSWMENKHLYDYFPHEVRQALRSFAGGDA